MWRSMIPSYAIVCVLATVIKLASATTLPPAINSTSISSTTLRYEAPGDCIWWLREGVGPSVNGQDVALVCKLRTINGGSEESNFSVIPAEHTISLKIECSSELKLRSSLSEKSFAHLSLLRELVLEYCKMGDWKAETLTGLRDLRNLTVRTRNTDWPSMSLNLSPDSFAQVKQLERLDLSTNNIWRFGPNLLCPLTNLIMLNVSHNRLQDIMNLNFRDGLAGETSCQLNIRVLDASHNHFVTVPSNAFAALPELQELRLHNNEISMIGDRVLGGLENLKYIDLSSNEVVTLPADLFAECSESIKEIYLQNNSLSVLSSRVFANLSQLLSLDLSSNQLSNAWFSNETFSGLIRLVLLNLARNQITKLNATFFRDLYTLQILNLGNNALESIPPDTFTELNNLHTLILSNNRLKHVEAHSLNGLYALSLLSLDYNQLESIHRDAFRNCSLQDLNISANKFTEIPVALQNMHLLKTLDLGENLIVNIEKPGFKGMTNLYGLRLVANQIEFVGKKSFVELPSLQILNLSQNQIKKIDAGTFANNSKLEAVRLDNNLLTSVDAIFEDVKSLVWLNISENRLKEFDYGVFPSSLIWLDVHKNFIEDLRNEKHVKSYLQTLDVSFNKLTRVAPTSLPDSIELLFLNDNHIVHVEPHTFAGKTNLTRVDLYANSIVNLNLIALQLAEVPKERALPEFYIGGNPFKCDCTMEWLQYITGHEVRQRPVIIMDIENIYCSLVYDRAREYIPLTEAKSSQFLCPYKTHCYTVCQCCQFDACDCELNCPVNCSCFHDNTWTANIVDCSHANYSEMPLKIPMDATELYLDGNDFGKLSSHSFIGRKNLLHLYINNSNIQVIYNYTFSGIGKLVSLHLEDNQITALEGHEFSSLENLKELYLQNNKITQIDDRTFLKLKNLEILRLDNNRLHKFTVWQLSYNAHLTMVAVSGNPWSCDCQFVGELRMWIQENFSKIADIDYVSCQLKNETNSLSNFLRSHNNTAPCLAFFGSLAENQILRDYLPFFLLTSTIFVVIVIFTMLIIVYRKEVQVCLYTHCGLRSCYKSTTFGDNKLFDAYVAYCIKDEDFVTQIMCPCLEQCDAPYRLCLHYRDFNINSYIADTIIEAAESSKRTLIVLSKNFLQTEWCRFEYKSALREVLRDRRNKVMFVLLGEIPARDLDPDLRLYMKVSTCLQWGDSLFWQKFRYFMPDVKESPSTFVISSRSSANVYATPFNYYGNGADRSPNSNYSTIPSPPPRNTLKKAYNQCSHSLLPNGTNSMQKNVNGQSLWT